jgi:hypothetical protein
LLLADLNPGSTNCRHKPGVNFYQWHQWRVREGAVPNSLDIAKQRKLVEDLKRDGQQTQDAETRLRDLLDVMTSLRGYRSDMVDRGRQKGRQDRPTRMG